MYVNEKKEWKERGRGGLVWEYQEAGLHAYLVMIEFPLSFREGSDVHGPIFGDFPFAGERRAE